MKKSKGPCWTGYTMVGMKSKGKKKVPNCVPVKKANEGLSVRPYDPRDKKQKKITDKKNPISEYDPKTKKLKYTSAYTGRAVRQPTETNKEFEMRHEYHTPFGKPQKARGGGIAIKGTNFQGVF